MKLIEQNLVVIAQATNQRVSDCLGLIENLFEHEVCKSTLLRSCCIPGDFVLFKRKRFAIEVTDSNAIRANGDDFILSKLYGALGVIDKRCNIGSQEVLAIAKTCNEWRVAAHTDNCLGRICMYCKKSERTTKALYGSAHSGCEIAIMFFAKFRKQVSHRFCISL
ncbi:unannotated protein [freshwater metagenome]|uniref:Unannotated protein n=1 Tax=freshwater metagenome TaxID=449393 RepID=A0A6J7TY70_9ZZZZ